MLTNILRVSAASALLFSVGACATVTRGSNTAFEVQTTPPGASVVTSNGHQCPSTPCSMKMPRRSDFTVAISKPGYKTVNANVTNKVAGAGGVAMAGNVVVGGIIGAGVDVASGAMLDLTPNPMILTLEPAKPAIGRSVYEPTS